MGQQNFMHTAAKDSIRASATSLQNIRYSKQNAETPANELEDNCKTGARVTEAKQPAMSPHPCANPPAAVANEPGQIWLPVDVRPQISRFRKQWFFLGRRGAAWGRLIFSPSSMRPKTASEARSEAANQTMKTASLARPDSFHVPRSMSITLGLSCSIGAACGLSGRPARSSRCAVVSSQASSMRPRSSSV